MRFKTVITSIVVLAGCCVAVAVAAPGSQYSVGMDDGDQRDRYSLTVRASTEAQGDALEQLCAMPGFSCTTLADGRVRVETSGADLTDAQVRISETLAELTPGRRIAFPGYEDP